MYSVVVPVLLFNKPSIVDFGKNKVYSHIQKLRIRNSHRHGVRIAINAPNGITIDDCTSHCQHPRATAQIQRRPTRAQITFLQGKRNDRCRQCGTRRVLFKANLRRLMFCTCECGMLLLETKQFLCSRDEIIDNIQVKLCVLSHCPKWCALQLSIQHTFGSGNSRVTEDRHDSMCLSFIYGHLLSILPTVSTLNFSKVMIYIVVASLSDVGRRWSRVTVLNER